jgi:hypothetical protein
MRKSVADQTEFAITCFTALRLLYGFTASLIARHGCPPGNPALCKKTIGNLSREQFLDRESDRKLVHQPYLLALAHHRTASRPSQRIMRSTLGQAKLAFDWRVIRCGVASRAF